MKPIKAVVVAIIMLAPTGAWAGNDFDFGVGFEQFVWREYDTAGNQLLEEKGPRFVMHGHYEKWLPSGAVFGGQGDLYFGSVDYDGQTQSGVPVQTDTDYSGFRFEGGGGYLAPVGAHGIGVIGSIGFDSWIRSLQSAYDRNGNFVYGYDEEWFTFYARIAAAWNTRTGGWEQRLRAGLKYPFYTENYVPDFGVTLEPEPGPSYFVNWETHWAVSRAVSLGLALYYEYTVYDASDPELAYDGNFYYQPESRQWVTGARFQMAF
jgi:hypothetical protein